MPLDRVHFHEVGAVDSIVDLVGAAAAVEHLAPERLTCGPVNVGSGRVRTAHGELPVPAPATAELLAGIPIYGGPGGELTTPTGAVLLAELVDDFVELPDLVLEAAGYGLGRRDLARSRTPLRLLRGALGRGDRSPAAGAGDRPAEVMVVECEIDDLPGEGFGFLMERLLAAGALDVYFTPVQMKKSRPGTLVTLLCRRPQLEELAGLLLARVGLARLPLPPRGALRGRARHRWRSPPRSARCGSSEAGWRAARSPPPPSSRTAAAWRWPPASPGARSTAPPWRARRAAGIAPPAEPRAARQA